MRAKIVIVTIIKINVYTCELMFTHSNLNLVTRNLLGVFIVFYIYMVS